MFGSYLKVQPVCAHCKTPLHHHRADDAPPYFTMMIVAHLVVPGLLFMERLQQPPMWLHAAIWLPVTIILSWWLMPRVKGAIVGIQWANHMHGFGTVQIEDKLSPRSPT
jgi:uncharacterized protein (DUF983 family)